MSALLPLRAETLAQYVRGGPIHVAVEIAFEPAPARPGVPLLDELDERPRLELLAPSASLGLELWGEGDEPLLRVPPRSGAVEPEGVPGYTLRPGERRRVLVELGERLPTLTAERYRLELSYEAEGLRCHGEPLALCVRDPSPGELDGPIPPHGTSWSRWSLAAPEPRYAFDRVRAEDPARFCRVIRELVRGPQPLARIDPTRLEALEGLYAPEREALTVELLVARHDHAGARARAQAAESSTPGLRWWLEAALAGQGPITSLRTLLERLR
ncbi:MAG: hypothetical protein KDK70_02655 [Myxococcales bacterium]|nr:hypothetical protein [Myxococcales bacterium]